MPEHVYKSIEITGSSTTTVEHAITRGREGIGNAAQHALVPGD